METICGLLFRTRQLLDVHEGTIFSEERFIGELVFSLIGLSPENRMNDQSFISLSGKTRVELRIEKRRHNEVTFVYSFESQVPPLIQGSGGYEQMRKVLMGKVSAVLTQHPSATAKAGNAAPFQVFVHHENLPLALSGITSARSLVVQILRTLEANG
jgi:hypothetical protein